jgi:hypothetical protein
MPSDQGGTTHRSVRNGSLTVDHADLVEFSVSSINEKFTWNLQISRSGDGIPENPAEEVYIHYNYLFYTWPGEDDGYVVTNLVSEIEEIKSKGSLFPRERFLVVITDTGNEAPSEAALSVLKELWSNYMILDVLVLVPYATRPTFGIPESTALSHGVNKLLLYALSPYHESEEQITLVNAWVMENGGHFLKDSDLFVTKFPPHISGPPLKVATYEEEGFLTVDRRYTDENNEEVYNITGPEIDILLIITQQLNVSVRFLIPLPKNSTNLMKIIVPISQVADQEADVGIGLLPLVSDFLTMADSTVPYIITSHRWYVSCPRPLSRLSKIAEIFQDTTWLMMGIVILFVFIVTWGSAKRADRKESDSYRSVGPCSLNIFAMFVGMPVPDLPRTSITRLCFLLFVWYSFAMSTVFQTFFTSILVDPGVTQQISSFEEILSSGIEFDYNKELHIFYYPVESDLYGDKEMLTRGQPCSNYKECLLRLFNERDYATLQSELYAEYFVITTIPKRVKPICFLDSRFQTLLINVYLRKHSPLLDAFNRIISRVVESGILYKIFNDFWHNLRLQSPPDAQKYEIGDTGEDYFVFTTGHLTIAFCVLAVGYGASFLVFVGELFSLYVVGNMSSIIIYIGKQLRRVILIVTNIRNQRSKIDSVPGERVANAEE